MFFAIVGDHNLILLRTVSDSLIFLAYFTIPFGLAYLAQRKDIPFNWIFLAFACFIIFCGLTHLMEVWTLWHPDYWISGIVKETLTAGASITTAIALVPVIPKAIAIPSPSQLLEANETLHRQRESLRDLSGRLLTIQDEERRRIARGLHDSMGQELVSVKMLLENVIAGNVAGPQLPKVGPGRRVLRAAIQLVQKPLSFITPSPARRSGTARRPQLVRRWFAGAQRH